MSQEPILVPAIDNQNSCHTVYAGNFLLCARFDDCAECTSGDFHIWIKPDQMQDYLARKLVS